MSSAKFQPRDGFRPKLIALSVAACFSFSAAQSQANPTGGTVSSGSASFASSGNTLTVTNSANAIINWQSFSIGVNEITRFLQTSGSSAVLNRVVGANGVIPQSVIDGVLSSNGRVFLLNSSGIVIGAGARIDVAGFVASSLNLSDQDFLSGRLRFTDTPGAGTVSNAGVIDTTSGGAGGRVFLVGPDVQNSGVIRSPQGEIVLAAGKSVELVYENSPFVTVHLVADAEQALNVGQLISDSGRIGMFGALVRQGGVAEANSAVVGANGDIRLVATKDLTLDAGSRTTANGPSGGNVLLQAEGGTNLISGTVEAKGSSGRGGTIQALGVRVGVIGAGVIDASGDAGGGTVLVGGDAHGANPDVQNAQQTVIGPDGIIRADAGTTGDGGRVIVWSDDYTRFFGTISARGGSRSGNGGFVETSGAALQAFGSVDTSALNGQGGKWLLDPDVIEIVTATNGILPCPPLGGTCSILFNDLSNLTSLPGGTSQVSVAAIDGGLRTNGSVDLQAHVDINLLTNLTLTFAGGNFTAQAGNNINLNGNIVANGTNITLIANDAASLAPSGSGSITSALAYGNITTGGGSVNLSGAGIAVGTVDTTALGLAAGGVTMTTSTGNLVTGTINAFSQLPGAPGATVNLTTDSGNIIVNGSIDVHGAAGNANAPSGSTGGSVFLSRASTTVSGSVSVYGSILASGGSSAAGTGLVGGTGGFIAIQESGGDVLVTGNLIARGGDGGATNLAAGTGGAGGTGGFIELFAGNNLTVGSSALNVVDAGGGNGSTGAPAVIGASPIPGGAGGKGGQGGTVSFLSGQRVFVGDLLSGVTGGQATINSSLVANGGAGGAGGGGLSAAAPGGTGGLGGTGGQIAVLAGGSASLVGPLAVSAGAGGAGGAYGGFGGGGGSGGIVEIFAPSISVPGSIAADGGKAGDGAASGIAGLTGGSGGAGGSGGFILVGVINPAAAGGTINIGSVSALGGNGGAAGNGDTPSNTSGGAGGNGGIGGTIIIGETLNGLKGSSGSLVYGAMIVAGGAGGAGGVPGGLPGVNGADGTISIFRDFVLQQNPAVDLAFNATIAELGKGAVGNPIATGIDQLEKKDKDSRQKKDAAVCK